MKQFNKFWINIDKNTESFYYSTGYTISIYNNDKILLTGYTRNKKLMDMNNPPYFAYFLKQIELPIEKNLIRINAFNDYIFIISGIYEKEIPQGFVVVGPIVATDEKTQNYTISLLDSNNVKLINSNQINNINHIANMLNLIFTNNHNSQNCMKSYSRIAFDPYDLEQYFVDSIDYVYDALNNENDIDYNQTYEKLVYHIIKKDKKAIKQFLNTIIDLSLPTPSSNSTNILGNLRIKKNLMISNFAIINHVILDNNITSDFYMFFSSVIDTEFETASTEIQLRFIVNELIDKLFNNIHTIPADTSKQIRQCILYISNHINNKLTLEEVSKHVYLNPKYLSRLFHQETGMHFKQYVIEHKIIRAKRLLKYTKSPIDQIALAIGIDSGNNFSTFFKKNSGMTPNQYRNK